MTLSLFELFALGGWAMWPLLLFSVIALSLIAERAVFFLMYRLKIQPLQGEIAAYIKEGNIQAAADLCTQQEKRVLVAPIFYGILAAVQYGERHMERSLEAAAGQSIHTIERGFDLLVALGSIAPITGFLGTVSGMIGAFNAIANAADVNAQLVAGGIFEALITTAYGLAIAIIAITGHNVFSHFADRFAADIEKSGNELISLLLKQ